MRGCKVNSRSFQGQEGVESVQVMRFPKQEKESKGSSKGIRGKDMRIQMVIK